MVGALGGPAGVRRSQRPRHTSLGGRGVVPSWWWVLKEGLRGVAFPNCPGRGVLPRRWWVLKEGLRGTAAPNGPGTPALWGQGVLPRRWLVL